MHKSAERRMVLQSGCLLRIYPDLEYIAFLFASYGDAGKNKDYAIKMASYYDNKIKVVCE
jgi:hypothetical protein